MVDISRYRKQRKKERKKIFDPNISSLITPVSHNPYLKIPKKYLTKSISNDILSFASSKESDSNFKDGVPSSGKAPYILKQTELDDLARDLELTKANAELLTFSLKKWNLLHLTCEDTKSKERLVMFANFSFVSEHCLCCYCADVIGLFNWD